ncbi:hypothetical protein DOK78_002119 [Enterococcus sp. DIV2402]|uniref:HTH merR-type domain-containing protein n=1 Tax=Candidatus Enterococcus lowellii TaxID=2230877 RepID=A0ABZ2SSR1_9ENTE|nr:MerR family DNA-binding transcriptional regulator [Enterococcus sp. DIV2402]MBO0463755.1 MerR family DNA-binding transcriptional regulator [Enterococcus sp. DIV2402]
MRGTDIAKQLNISTSALRHYESWGIIPKVERQNNGYRIYTTIHQSYFTCIREMMPGFGTDFIKTIFPMVISGDIISAIWEINKKQVTLYSEKERIEYTIEILEPDVLASIPKYKNKTVFSIGEVAKEAGVSTSAIRHWEKEGLINAKRNSDSNFRQFTINDIRKIYIIRTVQRTVFSLDTVRSVLEEVEKNNITQTREIANKALEEVNRVLLNQFKGIAAFHKLLDTLSR